MATPEEIAQEMTRRLERTVKKLQTSAAIVHKIIRSLRRLQRVSEGEQLDLTKDVHHLGSLMKTIKERVGNLKWESVEEPSIVTAIDGVFETIHPEVENEIGRILAELRTFSLREAHEYGKEQALWQKFQLEHEVYKKELEAPEVYQTDFLREMYVESYKADVLCAADLVEKIGKLKEVWHTVVEVVEGWITKYRKFHGALAYLRQNIEPVVKAYEQHQRALQGLPRQLAHSRRVQYRAQRRILKKRLGIPQVISERYNPALDRLKFAIATLGEKMHELFLSISDLSTANKALRESLEHTSHAEKKVKKRFSLTLSRLLHGELPEPIIRDMNKERGVGGL